MSSKTESKRVLLETQAAATYEDPKTLVPWPQNPRRNDRAVDKVATSIRKNGFGSVIVARRSDRMICIGHTRWKAALKLELKAVPVRFLDLDDATFRRLALADNKLGEVADWDTDKLIEELKQLDSLDLGVELGWTMSELNKLGLIPAGPDGETPVPNATEELKRKWKTETGQIWKLGDSLLACGDSRNPKTVARLFVDKELASVLHTDQPYGVDLAGVKSPKMGGSGKGFSKTQGDGNIDGDTMTVAQLEEFTVAYLTTASVHLKPTAAHYLWHAAGELVVATTSALKKRGIIIHRPIVWVKPNLVLTRSGQYHPQHETCFYGWRRGHPAPWLGDKSQTSVWHIGKDTGKAMHPTQKPVELFIRPIANHTEKGDVVFEPFAGSGSQLIAAHRTGRRCRALDIDPKYIAVILERFKMLGVEPQLVDGIAAKKKRAA